jgi:D-alanyl-lipoteichoic acid acyltransferase DltB (MBOAT superfamily)
MVFKPIYILILAGTIVIDYFAGIYIEKAKSLRGKKSLLIISLVANIGVLAFFKYFNFLNDHLTHLLGLVHTENPVPFLSILLPIGLSFHTFQAMSYTIEVYRGHQKAEYKFGIYALYVMFYPQLVAGPIERPQNILHQLKEKVQFNYSRVVAGLKMMLWGMFVKVVIADRLAIYVNAIFAHPENHSGISSLVGSIFFGFQIYGDFSGYSLIAIGCAHILGVDLMTNFKRPYLSLSIREFWSRWHISLSTWFRDYLYIPLGGNRVTMRRNMFNLFFVFLVSGLWHGASNTFIIWGALHGIYLMVEILSKKYLKLRLPAIVQWLITFILVMVSWIFFRAESVHKAWTILSNIISMKPGKLYIGNDAYFLYDILLIAFLFAADFNTEKFRNKYSLIHSEKKWLRWAGYAILVYMILAIGVINGGQFIYFQF